uniref:Uncharacterized protein n=1 Tax=Treubia lacunosa TaxID=93845 RepID=G4Y9R8_9MARC|nr:hypothetical protein TrlaMp19 [Treubia lacunosa]AEH99714.1 hypothetical protein TrlaMp19 [Treubia lacunosa]
MFDGTGTIIVWNRDGAGKLIDGTGLRLLSKTTQANLNQTQSYTLNLRKYRDELTERFEKTRGAQPGISPEQSKIIAEWDDKIAKAERDFAVEQLADEKAREELRRALPQGVRPTNGRGVQKDS